MKKLNRVVGAAIFVGVFYYWGIYAGVFLSLLVLTVALLSKD
ncbi:hypothetical protein [Aneurinibacillus aneurinilyticus]|uniref:Uncharacterized protein n=1 Tax=Aneurinibacillus aneurinilyticus ATCC 12856 TaxID=649747 RepID=U1Y915_ANEAE|nr:hypothetical protein [Aneurinibacillus aneurinilyticus]ERI07291.1 hypothetical protein HMPREF0083_04624 [Aneurinibacillus aneurinilyticus ATCC 12856]MED0709484.1 hypothetical protein [Aneurinibacillus aneurinilyticus]MED0725872.1 hypothetical protein [Aneurinibacillus aneurinilyticus]MED0730408.1 hypothetical protein [Aneurinibacillus aneurinilyticus]MED0739140.1 hypothetical protein [Aneurinibacillus aneurinilyticus]